jgi:ferredoxin
VAIAPEVFVLGDDDVLVWQEEVADERRAAEMEAAVEACPMSAIRIED